MKRAQTEQILKDLKKKMVFIVGPRQVGKTFIAKQITQEFKHPVYLNYDNPADRNLIHAQGWLQSTDLLVLDELHKMPEWKNYLKGIYDTKLKHLHILVTGSARLEVFNHIGDSLAGRYFLHHLLPLSPAELKRLGKPSNLEGLLKKSGFPEPYLAENEIEANRWRMQYTTSLLSTDIFDFDKVQNIRAIQTIFEMLRIRVGSPISYQSLAEDVGVSPATVKKYIQILEAVYLIFQITPFSKNIARSLLKEPKIYFFDTGLVKGDKGAKLENLVALCLLKNKYAAIDYYAKDSGLYYLRTKDKQEVDFVLTKNNTITKIIEVKYADKSISPSLRGFHKKYDLPAIQLVQELRQEQVVDGITLMQVENYLADLIL